MDNGQTILIKYLISNSFLLIKKSQLIKIDYTELILVSSNAIFTRLSCQTDLKGVWGDVGTIYRHFPNKSELGRTLAYALIAEPVDPRVEQASLFERQRFG